MENKIIEGRMIHNGFYLVIEQKFDKRNYRPSKLEPLFFWGCSSLVEATKIMQNL